MAPRASFAVGALEAVDPGPWVARNNFLVFGQRGSGRPSRRWLRVRVRVGIRVGVGVGVWGGVGVGVRVEGAHVLRRTWRGFPDSALKRRNRK